MNAILETALEVQSFCRARAWRFCIIGALAVQRWGEPRLTQDVDVTVISGFGSEAEFVDSLLSAFRGRIPDARAFALRHRVVLLESGAAVPIDVALGGIPSEERIVDRASGFDVGGSEPLLTCSAEDVPVVFLLFLVWLVVHGPGFASLDALLWRRWGAAGSAAPNAPEPAAGPEEPAG